MNIEQGSPKDNRMVTAGNKAARILKTQSACYSRHRLLRRSSSQGQDIRFDIRYSLFDIRYSTGLRILVFQTTL